MPTIVGSSDDKRSFADFVLLNVGTEFCPFSVRMQFLQEVYFSTKRIIINKFNNCVVLMLVICVMTRISHVVVFFGLKFIIAGQQGCPWTRTTNKFQLEFAFFWNWNGLESSFHLPKQEQEFLNLRLILFMKGFLQLIVQFSSNLFAACTITICRK